MKRLTTIILGFMLLTGCGSVRYPTNYTLRLTPPPMHSSASLEARAVTLGHLAVREFRSPSYISEGRLVYRPNEDEVAFYEYHRWAVNPRESITHFVADALAAQAIFQGVSVGERDISPAYLLTGTIDRLEEEDHGRDVHARCTISARLIEVKSGTLIWQQTTSEAVPVRQRDVGGVVVGLSEAVRIIASRLVASMATQLASQPMDTRTALQ